MSDQKQDQHEREIRPVVVPGPGMSDVVSLSEKRLLPLQPILRQQVNRLVDI